MVRSAVPMGLLTSAPTVDQVLQAYASELGRDFIAYRNHVYRVMNLCAAIAGERADLEKTEALADGQTVAATRR